MIQNIKWHHDCMKTEGGVAIAKPSSDRTEIEGEIDESLSAKWSTWNTLIRRLLSGLLYRLVSWLLCRLLSRLLCRVECRLLGGLESGCLGRLLARLLCRILRGA